MHLPGPAGAVAPAFAAVVAGAQDADAWIVHAASVSAAGTTGTAGSLLLRWFRRGLARIEFEPVAVLLHRLQADALDLGQLLGALERTVFLAIGDDGLGLGPADVDQGGIDRRRIGGIDVDPIGGSGGAEQAGCRKQHAQGQRTGDGGTRPHGSPMGRMAGGERVGQYVESEGGGVS